MRQIPWSFDTNWIIAHGCLESSIAVESSDYPISEPEIPVQKPPLVLKPSGPNAGHCEIKILLGQKHEIGQIYVRSTARVYEIYYARSPQSDNEYLCTVRCGVAERDEKLLQTDTEDAGERFMGESITSNEDDWVKIKTPNIDKLKSLQDLYEATAQISDADPCSMLMIRLLSLQDKGHVYVDDIYVFAEPVEESTGSGNEAVPSGSSTGNSLMAMLVPTLLQLSRSNAAGQVKDKNTSDELLQDDKTETRVKRIDEIKNQVYQECLESAEPQRENSTLSIEKRVKPADIIDQEYVKLRELEKDKVDSDEPPIEKSMLNTKKHDIIDSPSERIERALEQLISRVSKVEEICLRFEEKMLKPIESMEARLQQVEHQVEKLAKNTNYSSLPHCTRFSAPAFSCTESNSSSLYEGGDFPPTGESELAKIPETLVVSAPEFNEGSDIPPSGESELEKIRPSLVVSAPEFSCGEDEEDNSNTDLKPLKDNDTKSKRTLSVDDALAAALNGFLSSAKVPPSEDIQTSRLSTEEEDDDYRQRNAQEFENGSRYTKTTLTVTAPDFTLEENGDEECLNCTQPSEDTDSVPVNDKNGHGEKMLASEDRNESVSSAILSQIHLDNDHPNEVPALNSSYEGDDTILDSSRKFDDSQEIVTEQVLGHQSEGRSDAITPNVLESSHASSVLDFEFPILEVKFASDICSSSKSTLEALLGNDDASGEHTNTDIMNVNEPKELVPNSYLLVDLDAFDVEGSSDLDNSHLDKWCTSSSPEMSVSLI